MTFMPSVAVSDHWVDHPQGRIFARQWAPAERSGAAILLLHDSLGCVELWRDFPSLLSTSTSRRVVAYDRLGFGRSDARSDALSVDFIAEEAALFVPRVRRHFDLDRFVVLGHSVGGGMAIELAAQEPAGCDGLVTIAAQAFVEHRTLEGIRAARVQFKDPAQRQRLARYHGDKTDWVLSAWIDRWLDPAFAQWTLQDVLPRVSSPVLALHGEADEFGSTLHPQMIGRLPSGCTTVEILPGGGHVPHREDADRVAALVAAFLSRRTKP